MEKRVLSSQGKREEINISAQKLEMKRESCAHDKHCLESLTIDKWVCGPESVIALWGSVAWMGDWWQGV